MFKAPEHWSAKSPHPSLPSSFSKEPIPEAISIISWDLIGESANRGISNPPWLGLLRPGDRSSAGLPLVVLRKAWYWFQKLTDALVAVAGGAERGVDTEGAVCRSELKRVDLTGGRVGFTAAPPWCFMWP